MLPEFDELDPDEPDPELEVDEFDGIVPLFCIMVLPSFIVELPLEVPLFCIISPDPDPVVFIIVLEPELLVAAAGGLD